MEQTTMKLAKDPRSTKTIISAMRVEKTLGIEIAEYLNGIGRKAKYGKPWTQCKVSHFALGNGMKKLKKHTHNLTKRRQPMPIDITQQHIPDMTQRFGPGSVVPMVNVTKKDIKDTDYINLVSEVSLSNMTDRAKLKILTMLSEVRLGTS